MFVNSRMMIAVAAAIGLDTSPYVRVVNAPRLSAPLIKRGPPTRLGKNRMRPKRARSAASIRRSNRNRASAKARRRRLRKGRT